MRNLNVFLRFYSSSLSPHLYYSNISSYSSLHGTLLWNYISVLPQVYDYLTQEYSVWNRYLFLNFLHNLTIKINFPISSEYSCLDTILISLRGLSVLQSHDIETRSLLKKLLYHIYIYKDQPYRIQFYHEAVCGFVGMDSNYLEVRSLLEVFTEIRIRYDIRSNIPIPTYVFQNSIPSNYHRNPARFGFKYLSIDTVEVQRFIWTLTPSSSTYSPLFPQYQECLRQVGSIPFLDVFHYLNLPLSSPDQHTSNSIIMVKSIHETGHLLISHLHPHSIFTPKSVYITSGKHASSSFMSYFQSILSPLSSSYTLSVASKEDSTFLLSSNPQYIQYSRAMICLCLGGMAAEFVVYGAVSPCGSDDDLQRVLNEIQSKPYYNPYLKDSNTFNSVTYPLHISSFLNFFSKLFHLPNNNPIPSWFDDEIIQVIYEEFVNAVTILKENKQSLLTIGEIISQRSNEEILICDLQHLLPQKKKEKL